MMWHSIKNLRLRKIVDCVDPFARRYDATHHLVKTFDLIHQNKIKEANDHLHFYHSNFKPKSTYEALRLHVSSLHTDLFEFPWGSFRNTEYQKKDMQQSRFCGPTPFSVVEKEFSNMRKLYDSIRNEGFQPLRKRSLIGCVDLVAKRRIGAIIIQGNHRIACLKVIGAQSLLTTKLKGFKKEINSKNIDTWEGVSKNRFKRKEAEDIFKVYLEALKDASTS